MNSITNHSRRKFLMNLAKAGSLLPFAGHLLGQNVFAQNGGAKRVLFLYHPNGVPPVSWNPADGVTSIASSTQELSFCLGPLAPWHSKIIVLKNIFIDIESGGGGNGGGHTNAQQGVLTGNYHINSSSASIDHLIAKRLNELNPGARQDVLSLGVRNGSDRHTVISKPFNESSDSRSIPNNNPRDVAQKLSAKVTAEPISDYQKRIYDAVLSDFDDLASAALDGVRKEKINQHLIALQRLKDRASVGLGNIPFNLNAIEDTATGSLSVEKKWEFPLLAKAQMDNIVAAFANGLHRVATLQLAAGNEHSNWTNFAFEECWQLNMLAKERMPNLHLTPREPSGEHATHGPSHNFGNTPAHAQTRWYNTFLAYTLNQLNEAGILDDTLVVMFAETGDSSAHNNSQGSIIVAGGAGGSLPMGRVINCGTGQVDHRTQGTHQLFGDIARLMGVTGLQESYWTGGVIT
jgi:hypothetical protein